MCPAPVSNFHHPAPTHPALALAPAAPAAHLLFLGIPMDVDMAKQPHNNSMWPHCYAGDARSPGTLHSTVPWGWRSATFLQQSRRNFLQLLAAKDTAGALSLDKPSLELTLEKANVSTSPPELEGNF
ncbi:hypothetical protein C0989_004192 [Termitomyces sp. Mn162]|nr:hypothetical protein C0989_004192 [Termitomyces sp. Mn162]